jgi:hypothetical protein
MVLCLLSSDEVILENHHAQDHAPNCAFEIIDPGDGEVAFYNQEMRRLLLAASIADCYSAMECLGERSSDEKTWDHIASEIGLAYLTVYFSRVSLFIIFLNIIICLLIFIVISCSHAQCTQRQRKATEIVCTRRF